MRWLFETDSFVPRSHCGVGWSELLQILDRCSNLIIFLSYLAIVLLLMVLWYRKGHQIPHSYLLTCFALFLLFCGLTHLNDYWVFWWPAYRYIVLIDIITALFSFATVIVLIIALRFLLLLPSLKELISLNEKAQIDLLTVRLSENNLRERCNELINQVNDLERTVNTGRWVTESKTKIERLKRVVESLR